MDIKYLIEDFLETKNIQQWINNRFNDPKKVIIDLKLLEQFPVLTTADGIQFYNSSELLSSLHEVLEDYQFSDIQPDDSVIDIGANIGCFSLLASRFSKHINAVEPILTDDLRKNVTLNHKEINIIDGALGDGEKHEVIWRNIKKIMNTYSFSQLKEICGGCDFLKCDCEGFEWFIEPEELKGVRRLEIELHNFNPSRNDPKTLIDYIVKDYDTIMVSRQGRIIEDFQMDFRGKMDTRKFILLHATKKNTCSEKE